MNKADAVVIDWERCTFEGAEREQLRRWIRLPLRDKLRALEQMCDHAEATIAWRKTRGLPYLDPATGELTRGGEA